MNHHCPKCPGKKVYYCAANRKYQCQSCKSWWSRLEVAFIKGGKK